MKKIAILSLVLMLVLTGCGKKKPEDLVGKFEKSISNAKSYVLKGNMEILSNEETFTYSLEASYLKDNFYKVTLVNQTNNHEQIILKNKDGVYVVTPALNKSFKFQSEWPENSSQSYILSSILKDIKNDKEMTIEEKDKGYVIKSKVNYPNNKELTYQKIYFDKNMNLESVEVYNNENIVNIKVMFSSVNLKGGLEEEDFALDKLIDVNKQNEDKNKDDKKDNKTENKGENKTEGTDKNTTDNTNKENCTNEECDKKSSNIIDSVIYPLYIPSETYLSNSEKVDTDDGNRVILTFAGEKNFVLIEEVANVANEFEIIPVYGDPVMLSDTIAAKSANSLVWSSEGLSYYLTSSDLSTEEMVTIAESLGNAKTVVGTK
ncbi:MAG: hypothetical protein HFI49_02720 [Bacilli bacterium]|nr:hypothetical protein [Bacilli bacterium]